MLRADGKPPKLNCKGAETRHLVPFALECAAAQHAHRPTVHNFTVLQCVSALMDFYLLMTLDVWNSEAALLSCKKCTQLYSALSKEQVDIGRDQYWRVKPKAHLFSELGEMQQRVLGNPSTFWNYRDEDWAGYVAKLAHSKGGQKQHPRWPNNHLRGTGHWNRCELKKKR
eukprot:11185376-Lingulodinium_polyedra.AAC.1